jgi:Sec20
MASSYEPSRSEIFRREKDALFEQPHDSSGQVLRQRRRPVSATDATAAEAAAIQQSLQRTQKLLQSELSRVSAVQRAIEDDEKLLRETMDTHKTLNVSAAKRALTELERAEQHERRVLAASIFFFWSVVFYVVWCRVLIRIPFLDRILGLFPLLWDGALRFANMVQTKISESLPAE